MKLNNFKKYTKVVQLTFIDRNTKMKSKHESEGNRSVFIILIFIYVIQTNFLNFKKYESE